MIKGSAFKSDDDQIAKVELKSLAPNAVKGFLTVLLPLLLNDAKSLDLEVYLRRSDTQPPSDPLLGSPVWMDMRIFVTPTHL